MEKEPRGTICTPLEIVSKDGRKRKETTTDLEGMLGQTESEREYAVQCLIDLGLTEDEAIREIEDYYDENYL